jgi:hypothetical protein
LPSVDSRHGILAANSGLFATPALLWRGQSLPAASAPAPGPHTSRIDDGLLQSLCSASVLSGLLRDLFSHRLSNLGNKRERLHLRTARFQPHGILNIRMSLSTLLLYSRRSAAASLWSVRNPCVIQADSEPPGRLPPAPGSHIRCAVPLPGGAFVSSGGVELSSTLADSRPISLVLTESQAMI